MFAWLDRFQTRLLPRMNSGETLRPIGRPRESRRDPMGSRIALPLPVS